ncbi:MAG: hypothetical protein HWD61_08025 [Parachlamydiaceae bacterium]|nr:MAG: hypothetical protein HWD61_08025 [Parachlamydiaceae bacterium]
MDYYILNGQKLDRNVVVQAKTIEALIELAKNSRNCQLCLNAIQLIYGYLLDIQLAMALPLGHNFFEQTPFKDEHDLTVDLKAHIMKKLIEVFPNQLSRTTPLTEKELYQKALELNINVQFPMDKLVSLGLIKEDIPIIEPSAIAPPSEKEKEEEKIHIGGELNIKNFQLVNLDSLKQDSMLWRNA